MQLQQAETFDEDIAEITTEQEEADQKLLKNESDKKLAYSWNVQDFCMFCPECTPIILEIKVILKTKIADCQVQTELLCTVLQFYRYIRQSVLT